MKDYNEQKVLERYVLTYHEHLFTRLESLGFKAALAEEKASGSSPKMAEMLRNKWGSKDNPEVVQALSQGFEKFRDAVYKRLMQECADKIVINRCPKCSKIARTPRSKQCPWCFHSWH